MGTNEELMTEYSKWISEANIYEAKYKEAIQNAESIQRVIHLMKAQVSSPAGEERKASIASAGKYENMSMTAAIFDILKNENNLTTDDIYQRLVENGFKSKSRTLKRDVATRLSRLKKQGNINSFKEADLYRHCLNI